MANAFDELGNGVIGEVTQDGVTYATAPTPLDGDESNKVATTEFVKGVAPSGNVAVWSRDLTITKNGDYSLQLHAPSGGTWFMIGHVVASYGWQNDSTTRVSMGADNRAISGGSIIDSINDANPRIKYYKIAENNAILFKIA